MCFCLQIAIKLLLHPVPELPALLDPVRATAHTKTGFSQAVRTVTDVEFNSLTTDYGSHDLHDPPLEPIKAPKHIT